MSSWHHAFLFPRARMTMSPVDGVSCLTVRGLAADGTIRLCVPIDEAGHLLDVGDEVALTRPFMDDLKHRLQQKEDFSIQFRNCEIVLSCIFAMQAANPHILLGWSRRLFGELSVASQLQYWQMIRDFAAQGRAGFVLVVDDAPDHFEDYCIDIDGVRFLDLQLSDAYGHGVQEVRFNEASDAGRPEGVTLTNCVDIGRGFQRCLLC